MSFISYAQNFEDVMLWRVLKHVEHGFYIDVGAWSPDQDSVTRAFYEHGWQGINVEPNPEFNRQLQERRPRDTNLCIAVGDHEDTLIMNFLGNPGLSTLNDTIAERHQQSGWEIDRQEVQVTTLSAIWQNHVPTDQEVHFLKVDVEGFEEAALRGNDWALYRPWVVVVEATLPMSQVDSYETWEPILLDAKYHFVYADGLNRYYVAGEHENLVSKFKYPPNVFDDFVLSRQQDAEVRATQAEARAQQAEAIACSAMARSVEIEGELRRTCQVSESRHQQLQALLNSRSWRVTAPLRWLNTAVRGFALNALKSRVKVRLHHMAIYVGQRPRLKRAALFVLNRFPRLKRFVARLLGTVQSVPAVQQIRRYEDLRSVRIMQAISALPSDRQPVTFLDIADHDQ